MKAAGEFMKVLIVYISRLKLTVYKLLDKIKRYEQETRRINEIVKSK